MQCCHADVIQRLSGFPEFLDERLVIFGSLNTRNGFEEIRRAAAAASQAVFARYLNVTTGLVSQWERGEKHPQGASLKLLSLVARNGLGTVA